MIFALVGEQFGFIGSAAVLGAYMTQQLEDIRSAGLQKSERVLLSPQGAAIRVAQGEVLNLCANNYLGLANHPEVTRAAADGLREYGNGMLVSYRHGQKRRHRIRVSRHIDTCLAATTVTSSCPRSWSR